MNKGSVIRIASRYLQSGQQKQAAVQTMKDVAKTDLKLLSMLRDEKIKYDWWKDPNDYKYRERHQEAIKSDTEAVFFKYIIPRDKKEYELAEEATKEALQRLASRILQFEKQGQIEAKELEFEIKLGRPQIDVIWHNIKQRVEIIDTSVTVPRTETFDLVWEFITGNYMTLSLSDYQRSVSLEQAKNWSFFHLLWALWYRRHPYEIPSIIEHRQKALKPALM